MPIVLINIDKQRQNEKKKVTTQSHKIECNIIWDFYCYIMIHLMTRYDKKLVIFKTNVVFKVTVRYNTKGNN